MQTTQEDYRHLLADGSGNTGPAALPKSQSHSTIHRIRVQPADVGGGGCVAVGTLLEWIGRVACATAAQWSGSRSVMVSVDNVRLDRPVGVGDVVELHANLVYTGRSSMHVLVTVYSSYSERNVVAETAQCAVVLVAVDASGPVEVPPWTPNTMLEMQRHHQARVRIATRKRVARAIQVGRES